MTRHRSGLIDEDDRSKIIYKGNMSGLIDKDDRSGKGWIK